MKINDLKKYKLPDSPGVYFFYKGKNLLYVGKATSLRDRTKSYFSKDLIVTRGPLILDMTVQADNVKFEKTDTVLEALILEASLIKKYQPRYNTKEKDNKSFNYVCITSEDFPQVLVLRGRNILQKVNDKKYQASYGPFTNGMQLRMAMKIIRRIFPYIDTQSIKKDNFEFYRQLGLTPEVGNKEFKESYKKNIANLKLFFEGKKKKIIINFKKEMMFFAKNKEFEKAGEIKKRIFALEHINDVALIKEDFGFLPLLNQGGVALSRGGNSKLITTSPYGYSSSERRRDFRIEAYDIAHMAGQNMVGVMVVVVNGQIEKNEYKKFIIESQTNANDTGALEEILSRRFRHTEWGLPSLVVVDGSTAVINVAKRVLQRYQFEIPVISVVKDNKHKAKALIGDEEIIKIHKKSILLANSESHRFAINFHKLKRNKSFLNKK